MGIDTYLIGEKHFRQSNKPDNYWQLFNGVPELLEICNLNYGNLANRPLIKELKIELGYWRGKSNMLYQLYAQIGKQYEYDDFYMSNDFYEKALEKCDQLLKLSDEEANLQMIKEGISTCKSDLVYTQQVLSQALIVASKDWKLKLEISY